MLYDLKEAGVSEELIATRLTIHTDAYTCAVGADAIVVATEWDEFKTLDYKKIYAGMNKPAFVFDGRLILDAVALREIGFTFQAIGKPGEDVVSL
jgi:UDPglucose 6-dehydrogenase